MNQRNDQSGAHQAADMVDSVADGFRSAAQTVGGNVRNAAQSVRDAAERGVGAVEETYEQAHQCARDTLNRGRAQARSLENSVERCVRDNPAKSLLVAAAAGLVVGLLWKK